jgi:hypothetical protein
MSSKPTIDNKALENITTLALLVGRFDKMQVHDIRGSDMSLFDFEVRDWREDSDFRRSVEPFAEHYSAAKTYVDSMNQILEKQNRYRLVHGLKSPKEWLAEQGG